MQRTSDAEGIMPSCCAVVPDNLAVQKKNRLGTASRVVKTDDDDDDDDRQPPQPFQNGGE